MLVMQAGKNSGSSRRQYGYIAGAYGKITPDYIMYKGEKYVIKYFYALAHFPMESYLSFQDNKVPNGERLIVEVNGTVYTLTKQTNSNQYSISGAALFTSVGTYTIKILSIE